MAGIAASWVISPLLGGVIAALFLAFIKEFIIYREDKIDAAKAEKEFWDTAKKALITNGVSGIFALVKVILLLAALGLTVKFSMPETTAKIILGIVGK